VRHIFLAVSIDEELKKLLHGVTIPQGGVLPHINSFLLKNKSANEQSPSVSSSGKAAPLGRVATAPAGSSAKAAGSSSSVAVKSGGKAKATSKDASAANTTTA